MATVLEIGEAVADRCRLQAPTSLIGNTGMTERQILRAIRDGCGKDAYRDVDWQNLVLAHEWTTDGSSTYGLPTDYGRYIPGTGWDTTNWRRVIGPVTSADWERFDSGLVSPVGINKAIYIVRDPSGVVKIIQVFPITDSGTTLRFRYISDKFILDTDGSTLKTSITADSDTFLIPDDLSEVASIVRMKRMLGLGYAEETEEYEALVVDFGANDDLAQDLHLDMNWWRNQFLVANLPDTGYGGV